MGACFMASWISWPKEKSFDDWYAAAHEAIEKVEWDTLKEPEWLENTVDPDMLPHLQDSVDALRQFLKEHLDEIDPDSSEVGSGCMGDREFIVTGGMSWSDDPTEAFTNFNVVNAALGVLEM